MRLTPLWNSDLLFDGVSRFNRRGVALVFIGLVYTDLMLF